MSTLIEYADDVRAMEQKAVKERPILFSGAMVRAILSGQKTQTRRVVKHRWPHLWQEPWYATGRVLDDLPNQSGAFMEFRHRSQDESGYTGSPASTLVACPYGQPGDRLWVREAFHAYHWDQPRAVYRADGERQRVRTQIESYEVGRWKPSIHMPRWACRIVLEIVSVRVERLQDISEDDALAEGVQCEERIIETRYEAGTHVEITADMYHVDGKRNDAHFSAGDCFQALWESINGPESWDANPWVWVVEFRMVGK